MGMPLDQFTDEAYEGLASGKEEVTVGSTTEWYNRFEPERQKLFYGMVETTKKEMAGSKS